MGRRPQGEVTLTGAERQARYRLRLGLAAGHAPGQIAAHKLPRAKPHRKRSTDAELRDIIRRAIPRIGHSKSKLLAHLRRDLGIACEQERFSRLFSELGDHNAV